MSDKRPRTVPPAAVIDRSRDHRRIDPGAAPEGDFPVAIDGEYRIHFEPAAYQAMKAHAATTSEVELCGVLVGDVYRDKDGFYLEVAGAIEGERANNYGAQVTFTHETWDHIHAVKDADFPDAKIVGWYHTHPGFGVFLSSMDSFIQENFFNQPYQVAVVLETKKHVEGCFVWHDGVPTPIRRYWTGDREVALVTGAVDAFDGDLVTPGGNPTGAGRVEGAPPPHASARNWPELRAAIVVAACAAATAALFGYTLGARSARQVAAEALEAEVYSMVEFAAVTQRMASDLDDWSNRLTTIRAELDQGGDPAAASASLAALAENLTALRAGEARRRGEMRRELGRLGGRRQALGDRVRLNDLRQNDLESLVGELYLLRLADLLEERSPAELAAMSPARRQLVAVCLQRALTLAPSSKDIIRQMFPGLLDQLVDPADPTAALGGTAAVPAPTAPEDPPTRSTDDIRGEP